MCLYCTRYHRGVGPPPTCDAFPAQIPPAIFESRFDHRRAYAGDSGIRFELRAGYTVEQATETLP